MFLDWIYNTYIFKQTLFICFFQSNYIKAIFEILFISLPFVIYRVQIKHEFVYFSGNNSVLSSQSLRVIAKVLISISLYIISTYLIMNTSLSFLNTLNYPVHFYAMYLLLLFLSFILYILLIQFPLALLFYKNKA